MGIYLHVSVDKLRTLFFNYFFIYKISIYKIFYALKERKTKNIDFSVRVIRKIMFYVYFSDKKKKYSEFVERFSETYSVSFK